LYGEYSDGSIGEDKRIGLGIRTAPLFVGFMALLAPETTIAQEYDRNEKEA
jgi:hypothetical protein